MKVAFSTSFQSVKAPGTVTFGAPLLDPSGARVVLGGDGDALATPIIPSAGSLFGPRGVCLHPGGSFWVADTGHHRVLGWASVPDRDGAPADTLVGQPDFGREGRNAKGTPSATSLNVPTGLTGFRGGLAVADAWNHRVLIWHRLPDGPDQPADIVLGQSDFGSVLANHGSDRPGAATLHWPYGIAEIDGRLVVCDTGNRRVLIWDDPRVTGQPADLVLGQTGFDCRDENGGGAVAAHSMRWPHGIASWQGGICVSDAGNNRIMVWRGFPDRNGAEADLVLGQHDMTLCDHNMGRYYPSDQALNMPCALAVADKRLLVGDTANSRLIGFERAELAGRAEWLTGQPDFAAKGDNRWGIAQRDSLCWPYGLSVSGRTVAVADSGNNRVLLWDLAS